VKHAFYLKSWIENAVSALKMALAEAFRAGCSKACASGALWYIRCAVLLSREAESERDRSRIEQNQPFQPGD
jgi:hypothetical protein